MKHVVIFPQPPSLEELAEGAAIHAAVVSGKCNQCPSLAQCSTDDNFVFPADAFCMKEKARLLKESW